MKKTVLTYGLISAVIAAVLLLAHVPFMHALEGNKGLIVGYTGIVLSSLLIFFGVRSYRENVGNGKISFGRGFAVGILIALLSAAGYIAAWEVVYYSNPGFTDKIFDKQVESFKKLYANPVVNVAFTFIEPFPVGILMTLISTFILRRK